MINKNITLKSIGGYEYQKKEAKKIVDFFLNYDEYVKNGAKLPRGVIFYGRPGTGKTMFATAIANESKAKLYSLTDEKFYDNTNLAMSVHRTFNEAKKNAPSIVLVDELDQLVSCSEMTLNEPSDKQREMLRLLLTEIDKLDDSGVLVIATSNTSLRQIPSALVRNGRIEKHISISTPDYEDREAILDIYLKKNEIFKNIKSKELAKITNGFTGSSLSSLVNDILIKCLAKKTKIAKYDDFYDPIQTIISHGIKRKPKKNNDDVIYHEIGHLLTSYVLKGDVGIINTESFGTSEGRYYLVEKEEGRDITTLNDYEEEAIILLSGLAATEIFMGKRYSGAGEDISTVINIFGMINRHGLLDLKLTSEAISEPREFGSKRSKEYSYAQAEFVEKAYEDALHILKDNKEIVKTFYDILKDKKYMSSDEVKEVFNKNKVNNADFRKYRLIAAKEYKTIEGDKIREKFIKTYSDIKS